MAGMPQKCHHVKVLKRAVTLLAVPLIVMVGAAAESQTAPTVDTAAAAAVSPSADLLSDLQVSQLIDQLAAADFQSRQAAAQQLLRVQPGQIAILAATACSSDNDEISSRLMEILEQLFAGTSHAHAVTAWEFIETSAEDPRWMIAEAAARTLSRQQERRFALIRNELRKLGVSFNSSDYSMLRAGRFGGSSSSMLRINIDNQWAGGERGLTLLTRLAQITTGNSTFTEVAVGVYLIDGHPLQAPEIGTLKKAFGEVRVISRGRVCLGIVKDNLFPDEMGCRIGEVGRGTSADAAHLQAGDIILSVNETRIRDFDHLVDALRAYDVGDKVRMQIIRGESPFNRGNLLLPGIPQNDPDKNSPLPESAKMEITVLLKGWD